MDALHRKCRKAHRDVFRATFLRRGIADPLAGVGYDGLSGVDVQHAAFMLDAEHSFQHDGELVELGSLAGLEPSLRAAHVGDAGGGGFRVDAADVFVDEFGFVAGGLDSRGLGDECGHRVRASGAWLPALGCGIKSTTKAFIAEHAKEGRGVRGERLGQRLRIALGRGMPWNDAAVVLEARRSKLRLHG